ncbi:MAG: ABC transporter substrate-binding protein [Dehalococcoidia bacterium]|nr:ABC transporter substrate-binding protein [Dehalococcoidia bacterium]
MAGGPGRLRRGPQPELLEDRQLWHAAALLDKIDVQYIASPVDADAAFRTGEIDHRLPTNYEAWKELVNSVDPVVTQVTTPPPSAHPFIAMNLTKPPFDDVRVRRALALSVDRPALIDSLAGGMAGFGYGMDQTYFGSEWPFGPEELGDYHHYDPEQAKQLLADAGYEGGIPDTGSVHLLYLGPLV